MGFHCIKFARLSILEATPYLPSAATKLNYLHLIRNITAGIKGIKRLKKENKDTSGFKQKWVSCPVKWLIVL